MLECTSTEDASASDWNELIHVGKEMAQLGSRMMQLGNDRSKLRRCDVAEMMKAAGRIMQIGYRYLPEEATTSSASTTSEKRMCPKKRSRVAAPSPPIATVTFPAPPLPQPTDADLFLPVLDDVDLHLWEEYADLFATTESSPSPTNSSDAERTLAFGSPVNDVLIDDNSSTKAASSVGHKSHAIGKKGAYLQRLVAQSKPPMTLEAYLAQNDAELICLCGRGAHNNHHPGNKSYREFISSRLTSYRRLSKSEKEELTNSVVRDFEEQGRRFFVLNDDDEWEEKSKEEARKKISQRFRDA